MSIKPFEIMTVQEIRENLTDVIKLVARSRQRVEVQTTAGDRCVIICKEELDSLEKAIAILSDTDEFRDISHSLQQLASATNQPVSA